MQVLNGTIMAIFMESPKLNCIEVNLIGIFVIPVSIYIAQSSSVDFYNPLCNQINGQCQSLPTVQRRPPSCRHFGWSLPSRLTVQYWVCVLLNHLVFSIIIWGLNLQEQILLRHVRLSTEGYSQRKVARILDVSQGCVNKVLWCHIRCLRLTFYHRRRHHALRKILKRYDLRH